MYPLLPLVLALLLQMQQGATEAATADQQHGTALALYRQGQYSRAAELFERELEAKPNAFRTREDLLLLAQCYYVPGKIKEALPWLEKAVSAGVTNIEVSYMLGNAYIQTRQPEKAVAAFARLFGIPPGSAAAHLLTAQFMLHQEFEDDAAHQIASALASDARLPEAHYMLGEIATFRGRIEEAIRELNQEILINPGYAMAYYKLGDAYSRTEAWDSAIPNLQRAIWLNPTYSGPFILLGKAYWKRGEWANAEGILRRALVLDPRNASAHYLLGQTLVKMGRGDEGKKELEQWRSLQR